VAGEARRTEGLDQLLAEAVGAGVPIEYVDRAALDGSGAPDHQGVVAFVRRPQELDERDLASLDRSAVALVVVLDGITDPQNLGASARSAEAAGASALVTRKARSSPVTQAAVRASAGALLHLPVARVPNIPRALHRLRDRGFFVVGLDGDAPKDVYAAERPPGPLALVVGAEGTGLSRLVRETCDELIRLPLAGRTASLNASAALAAALFAYALRPAAPP